MAYVSGYERWAQQQAAQMSDLPFVIPVADPDLSRLDDIYEAIDDLTLEFDRTSLQLQDELKQLEAAVDDYQQLEFTRQKPADYIARKADLLKRVGDCKQRIDASESALGSLRTRCAAQSQNLINECRALGMTRGSEAALKARQAYERLAKMGTLIDDVIKGTLAIVKQGTSWVLNIMRESGETTLENFGRATSMARTSTRYVNEVDEAVQAARVLKAVKFFNGVRHLVKASVVGAVVMLVPDMVIGQTLDAVEHNNRMKTDPVYAQAVSDTLAFVQELEADRAAHPTQDNTYAHPDYIGIRRTGVLVNAGEAFDQAVFKTE